MKILRILSFAAGSLLVFLVASGVSVYVVPGDHGPAGSSFQALCMFSGVATLLLLVGFGAGAALLRSLPGRGQSAARGAGCALVFVGALVLAAASHANPAQSWGLVLLLPFIGGISSLFQPKAADLE